MKEQSHVILQAVKGLLKQHNINYAQVAAHLGLSESSIKRSFSKGQISLERLIKICDMMNMEVVDLLQVIQTQGADLVQLTEAQEAMIVTNVKYVLVTVCVCNHWSFDDIHQTYELEEAELINILLKLEQTDLLELQPNNQIKLKISPYFHWIDGGPIQQFFERHIQQDFWQCDFSGPGEIRVLGNGMLSKSSNETMQKHINKLKQQFSLLAEQDQHLKMEQKHGTTLLVGMRAWELEMFAALRRYQDLKIYN